jgi:hypothetical protein
LRPSRPAALSSSPFLSPTGGTHPSGAAVRFPRAADPAPDDLAPARLPRLLLRAGNRRRHLSLPPHFLPIKPTPLMALKPPLTVVPSPALPLLFSLYKNRAHPYLSLLLSSLLSSPSTAPKSVVLMPPFAGPSDVLAPCRSRPTVPVEPPVQRRVVPCPAPCSAVVLPARRPPSPCAHELLRGRRRLFCDLVPGCKLN